MTLRDAAWQGAAREGRLADAIEAYIRQYDHVTFVELLSRLEPFADVRGDFGLELRDNVVLWAGMSESFTDAIEQLRAEKRVWPTPTVWLTYMIDGGSLSLPIAKRIPKGGYKKPHWLPVCLRVIEPNGLHGGRR